MGNGRNLPITHIGNSLIPSSYSNLQLHNVLRVPSISLNLVSVHKICQDNNCWCYFDKNILSIQAVATGKVLYQGKSEDGVYPIYPHRASQLHLYSKFCNQVSKVCNNVSKSVVFNKTLLHMRLGHPHDQVLRYVFPNDRYVINKSTNLAKCTIYLFLNLNLLLHLPLNLCILMYGVLPLSHLSMVFVIMLFLLIILQGLLGYILLNKKSKVFSKFMLFKAFVETQFSTKIKILRSNGGGEYTSTEFKSFLSQHGIIHQLSCPYTPQQNGLVERKHRHLIETTITLLSQASMSTSFCSYALLTATFLINLLPTFVLNFVSPWFKLYSASPDLSQLRIFSCACYPHLRPYSSHKLDHGTKECIFIGYSTSSKGYLCFDPSFRHIYTSRHVLFNEAKFPSSTPIPPISQSASPISDISNALWLSNLLYLHASNQPSLLGPYDPLTTPPPHAPLNSNATDVLLCQSSAPIVIPHSEPILQNNFTSIPSSTDPDVSIPVHSPIPSSISSLPTTPTVPVQHPMQTRSKSGIVKPNPKLCYKAVLDYTHTEPPFYKIASKHPVWCEAMDAEFQALQRQQTWSLVPALPHTNLVGCKWVFKIKLHGDGTITRYKARLVAKGFHQQAGIDYSKTFNPVVKLATVRLVLAIAVSCNWPLKHLDVSNAFLHDHLKEEVNMQQPPGYIDAAHPTYVCKLHKSLYGLKQAPRAWFERFTFHLIHLGFQASFADSSLFIFQSKSTIIYLLLYVDDIILTRNNSKHVASLISTLSVVFELKDLRDLNYFLSI